MPDEIPERVHQEAWTAAMLIWGYGETLTPDELAKAAAERVDNPGHRAVVESAYRAGQAAGKGDAGV